MRTAPSTLRTLCLSSRDGDIVPLRRRCLLHNRYYAPVIRVKVGVAHQKNNNTAKNLDFLGFANNDPLAWLVAPDNRYVVQYDLQARASLRACAIDVCRQRLLSLPVTQSLLMPRGHAGVSRVGQTKYKNPKRLYLFSSCCQSGILPIMKPLIYVILGPTATGKSDYAVDLALQVGGEIISADSRQIYRGMDLGTGKIIPSEMRGVPHHLLDIRDPNEDFSVEEFQRLAFEKIEEIISRGKVPIICGGTGYFISAVVDNPIFPNIPANPELRVELEAKNLAELQEILASIPKEDDAKVDTENKRRVIRAIELGQALGALPAMKYGPQNYEFELIGLDFPDDVLKERISKRLEKRLALGMIDEVRNLHASGVSWQRLENFGLEYRHIAEFLQGKISEDEMKDILKTKIWQYAKRQRTWFRRDERINWRT